MTRRPTFANWLLLVVTVFLGASPAFSYETAPIPPLRGHINDLANLLTFEQLQRLEEKLLRFEERKGPQIAVLTIPTVKPETIEQYAIKVVEKWKLGRKGVDDGVLLLVVPQDRAVRIEVGHGLEGVLPDAVAKRIIDEHMVYFFQRGDFYGGIEAGLERIIAIIEGEALPPPSPSVRGFPKSWDAIGPFAISIVILGSFLRMIVGRLPAALLGSGLIAIVLWIFTGSLGTVIIASLLVFIFLLSVGGHGGPVGTIGGRFSSRSGGGLSGGRWGFGGGFSGGGGSFGGGGASGRW